jgi:hypothetical protein
MAYWQEFNTQSLTTLVDETGAPAVIYIGYASPGNASNTSLPRRTIKRITDDGAGNCEIWFAGKNNDSDNVWDDRASLIYG